MEWVSSNFQIIFKVGFEQEEIKVKIYCERVCTNVQIYYNSDY